MRHLRGVPTSASSVVLGQVCSDIQLIHNIHKEADAVPTVLADELAGNVDRWRAQCAGSACV